MAVPSRTITYNDLNSFCKSTYDKTFINEVWWNTPFKQWLWTNRETRNWGSYITNPIRYAYTTSGVRSMSNTAWHPLQYDDMKIATKAQWEPTLYEASAAIKKQDEIFNAGEGEVVSWIQAKYEDLQERMSHDLSSKLYTSSSGWIGLQTAVAANPTTGTYAGIDRSDTTYSRAWRNQYTNAVSLAAMTLKMLLTLYNNCSSGQGTSVADFIVTTQAIWEEMTVRFRDSLTVVTDWKADPDIDISYPAIRLFGIKTPIVWDADCPAGYLYMLNSKFVKLRTYPAADMTQTPWKELESYAGKGKTCYVGGQLCVLAPNRCGVMFNLT